jgi:hypothetical protein
VAKFQWDRAKGNGVNDLLADGKAHEPLRGEAALQTAEDNLEAANCDEQPGRLDDLSGLQDILDAGRAESLFRRQDPAADARKPGYNHPAGFAWIAASPPAATLLFVAGSGDIHSWTMEISATKVAKLAQGRR